MFENHNQNRVPYTVRTHGIGDRTGVILIGCMISRFKAFMVYAVGSYVGYTLYTLYIYCHFDCLLVLRSTTVCVWLHACARARPRAHTPTPLLLGLRAPGKGPRRVAHARATTHAQQRAEAAPPRSRPHLARVGRRPSVPALQLHPPQYTFEHTFIHRTQTPSPMAMP